MFSAKIYRKYHCFSRKIVSFGQSQISVRVRRDLQNLENRRCRRSGRLRRGLCSPGDPACSLGRCQFTSNTLLRHYFAECFFLCATHTKYKRKRSLKSKRSKSNTLVLSKLSQAEGRSVRPSGAPCGPHAHKHPRQRSCRGGTL